MRGKTVVITGATSGIGEVAAVELARAGRAHRVHRARQGPRRRPPWKNCAGPIRRGAMWCIRRPVAAVRDEAAWRKKSRDEPVIDVLINNAGALFNRRIETEDGLEKTFALNHMSYFVLTNLLLPRLKRRRAHRLHRLGRASRRQAGFRRSAEQDELFSGFRRLFQIQALQHPVHPRTGAAHRRHRRHRQLPASGFCRHPLRRPIGRHCCSVLIGMAKPLGRDLAGGGRQDHHLSGVIARCRECQRRIFL